MPGMEECPCCLPPWEIQITRVPVGRVYAIGGTGTGTTIASWDTETGAFIQDVCPLDGQCDDIVVDLEGNLYYGNQALIRSYTMDGVFRWEVDHSGLIVRGLAATNDGYLYSCGNAPEVLRKWDTLTGSEITSGGWPYTMASGAFRAVCVDQSGNVYAAIGRDSSGNQVMSWDSSGSVRWQVSHFESPSLPLNIYESQWIAVDAMGLKLGVAMNGAMGSPHRGTVLSTVDGSVIDFADYDSTGTAGIFGCAWSHRGDFYVSGRLTAGSYSVTKNGIAISSSTPGSGAIVCGSYDTAFTSGPMQRYGAPTWLTSGGGGFGLEHWLGRVGALGVR